MKIFGLCNTAIPFVFGWLALAGDQARDNNRSGQIRYALLDWSAKTLRDHLLSN